MPRAECPVCEASIRLTKDEATYGSRVTCPECGASLEVVEEEPLTLEEVAEDWGSAKDY
ncbi:MAG: hypothetical protein XD60_1790 [Acetothermia bacterium 64_32]|nr:MAG: hypothetical protein XD60_1790 [Acetothermia bacterium 64_32]MBC7098161.1 lysine biosynthesis protein LysW [Candidatus Bipolaricaulota bacterium]HAF71440.1 lysine biosynthesis protein LysW [Candidatus Acetothermia bacterium]